MLIPGTAHAQTAPTLTIGSSHAFRNVVQDGDIFVLVRYELPFSISDGVSDAWCLYLENQTGCDSTPALPENPDTMLDQTASITFYTDCIGTNCSAATALEFADQLPRIDHALAGVYFAAGHTLTWNTATYASCIESNDVTFVTTEQECLNPIWSTAASDRDSQRADLSEQLLAQLRTTETNRSDPPLSIVNGNNLITENGRVFSLEALGVMTSIIPDAFQAAARAIATPFATVTGGGALQGQLDLDNSTFVTDWQTIGQFFFGAPGRNVTFMLTVIGAFVAAGFTGVMIQGTRTGSEATVSASAAMSATIFMLVMTIGFVGSAVPADGYFAWIFFSSIPMAWWIVGKIRSG